MDNVLAAFVTIFITLFAALSLSTTMLSGQETLREASQDMQARMDARSRTNLVPLSAQITDSGTVVALIYRNQGATKLTSFAKSDLIVQYSDNATPIGYHIGWLPFTTGIPTNNEWAVTGIYVNVAEALPEAYEPGILNPGEELKVAVKLSPPVGPGKTVQVALVTDNGVSSPTQVTRNMPPVVGTNNGLIVANGSQGIIDNTKLAATDIDNTPDQLIYTITTPPVAGTLSLGPTFTQAEINNNQLSYTRTGTADDSFTFTLFDGEATVGPYTFTLNP